MPEGGGGGPSPPVGPARAGRGGVESPPRRGENTATSGRVGRRRVTPTRRVGVGAGGAEAGQAGEGAERLELEATPRSGQVGEPQDGPTGGRHSGGLGEGWRDATPDETVSAGRTGGRRPSTLRWCWGFVRPTVTRQSGGRRRAPVGRLSADGIRPGCDDRFRPITGGEGPRKTVQGRMRKSNPGLVCGLRSPVAIGSERTRPRERARPRSRHPTPAVRPTR